MTSSSGKTERPTSSSCLRFVSFLKNSTRPPQLFLDSEEVASGKAFVVKLGLDQQNPSLA